MQIAFAQLLFFYQSHIFCQPEVISRLIRNLWCCTTQKTSYPFLRRALLLTEPCALCPDKIRRSRHQTLAHKHESWGHVRADLVKRTGLARQETRIAPPRHVFLMNLKGAARHGEDFVDRRRIPFSPRGPGALVYLPAHSEWSGWDEGDPTASYLLVSVKREFIEQTLGDATRSRLPALGPSIGFRDNTMEMALQKIGMELKHPDPTSKIMVESQVAQLWVQLHRRNGNYRESAKGGLSAFGLKRVMSMMELSPDERPTLDDMAKSVGVSRYHFTRAFFQSTGTTPQAHMAKRRVERSADMLRSTDLSATAIAYECGFGSSGHFSVAFKKAWGVSPIEFRRLWRL
jgi:AraC family transcriptional regulator